MFKARNENPYSDYYRLVVDRTVDSVHEGYETKDKMFSGYWQSIVEINSYFLDIRDFTAEAYGQATADIQPLKPSWLNDDGYFLLYGVTDSLELSEFSRGELTLTEGRYLTSSDRRAGNNVCIISDTIAELNGVSVGEPLRFQMADGSCEALTVVGIYRNHVRQSDVNVSVSYNLPDNRVFVPLSLFEKAAAIGCNNYQIKVDDRYIAEIEQLVNQYAMCEGYPAYFIRVSDIFDGNNREIHLLQDAVYIIKVVALVISSGLMFLYVSSIIQASKHEYGLMFALGESKCNLAVSVFVEFTFSAVIGVILCGAVVSVLGPDFCTIIIERLSEGSSVESLQNTTADLLRSADTAISAFAAMTENGFVRKHFCKMLLLETASVYSGFMVSLFAVFKLNTMKLLANNE